MIRELFGDDSDDEDADADDTPTAEDVVIGGKAVATRGADGLVAGADVRRLLESGRHTPEPALWIGYDDDPQLGFREAGIPFDSLFRHLWIAGVTGAGKTTELLNWMIQLAHGGYGFVYFDPKGRDSRTLLRMLPADRLDDVIWIEPGAGRDREIGLNLLDVPDTESDVELEAAIEDRLENLKASLAAKGELHATMESVTESMGRAMMRANADPEAPDYGVIDFYFILLTQERREDFAEECPDPYVREFLQEIADMDGEELRPLLKRVKAWVENGVVRRIVARRESTIDWRDVIDEDRIVVVRTPVESADVKRLTTLSVMRGVWSAVQSRSYETVGDPPPYFILADEFDDIASEQLDLQSMLARARSMRLSVTVACQYPSQLDEGALKPLMNNADNLVTFTANDREDARILMDRFRGYDAEDLIETSDYTVWTRLPLGGGDHSEPLKLSTFAPYPPQRPESAVESIIESSTNRYGEEPLSDTEIQRELPYGGVGEVLNDEIEVTDAVQVAAAQGVYDAACRTGDPDGYVSLGACAPAVRRRVTSLSETPVDTEDRLATEGDVFRRVLQHVDDELLAVREQDGETEYRARNPRSTIATVGEDQSAGGAGHALLLWDAYPGLTWAGLDIEINEATGTDADAVARPAPPDEQHAPELVDRLTGGGEVRLESEHETGKTKPGVSAQHCLQAANEGRRTIVLCRPDVEANVRDTLERDPPMCRSDHDVPGETRFYNSPRELTTDGEPMTRPGGRENVWVRDDETGEIILRDETGTEFARFEGPGAVFSGRSPRVSGGKTTIKRPIIPEAILEADAIEPRAEIVVVPEGLNQQPPGALADVLVKTDLDVSDGAGRLLAALREADARDRPVTATAAADHVDVTTRTARTYLADLAEAGALRREQTPGTAADLYHLG